MPGSPHERDRRRPLVLRGLLPLLASLLATGGLAGSAVQAQEAAGEKHMLWSVARGGETVGYLVGSVHLMKPGIYPLPDVYGEAFRASDVLAFETDLEQAQAESQRLIGRLGMFGGDETLRGALPDSTYATLQAQARDLGLNLAQMQKFEPWVMSLVVPVVQMQRAGYSGQHGIDQHFVDKAAEAGKPTVAFETPAEQLGFFDELPARRQVELLHYSLRQADRVVDVVDELAAAWSGGDTDRVQAIMQGEMRADFPDLYRRLIVERNRAWMTQITELLEGDRRPMIVVGVGHLTGGDGLVEMLRRDGYRVEQR